MKNKARADNLIHLQIPFAISFSLGAVQVRREALILQSLPGFAKLICLLVISILKEEKISCHIKC